MMELSLTRAWVWDSFQAGAIVQRPSGGHAAAGDKIDECTQLERQAGLAVVDQIHRPGWRLKCFESERQRSPPHMIDDLIGVATCKPHADNRRIDRCICRVDAEARAKHCVELVAARVEAPNSRSGDASKSDGRTILEIVRRHRASGLGEIGGTCTDDAAHRSNLSFFSLARARA